LEHVVWNVSSRCLGNTPPPEQSEWPHGEDLDHYPTPRAIIGQIGSVIAVCLGLALLVHVLLAAIGMS
jgi:hypothetical protein